MRTLRPSIATLALLLATPLAAQPFVFRGQLDDGAAPAEGAYALRLTLYPGEHGTLPLAGPVELPEVRLNAGRFAAEVDFGPLPPQAQGWLAVALKAADDADYTELPGRAVVALKGDATCPAAWTLGGNALTDAAVDFLGTTDAQPLELRVNGVRMARFEQVGFPETTTTSSNVLIGGPGNLVATGISGAMLLGGAAPPDYVVPSLPPGFSNLSNLVSDHFGMVLGSVGSVAGNQTGTEVDGSFATVIGSQFGRASGHLSFVLGGVQNTASGSTSLAGGAGSIANGTLAIALGEHNWAEGERSLALAGRDGFALGAFSSVVGGEQNMAFGYGAAVVGGMDSCAGAPYSWAGGKSAKVRLPFGTGSNPVGEACDNVPNAQTASGDHGTFIWADSGNSDFVSTGPNQFAIRARGGLRLSEETSQYFGATARQMLNLYNQTYGIGVQSSTLYQRSNNQFAWFRDGSHSDSALQPGTGGSLLMTLGATSGTPVGVARAQQFVNVSDRDAKTAFAPVDPIDVLARVLALPLSEWSYRSATGERHLGPMAQDFRAAFGLGSDDRTIATVDADGVALAAIQGLNAKLEAENQARAAEIDALRRELAELREQLRSTLPRR